MSVVFATSVPHPFVVEFGRPNTAVASPARTGGLDLRMRVLGGIGREDLFPLVTSHTNDGGLSVSATDGLYLGCISEPVTDERFLAHQTQSLYRQILAVTRGHALYRIWNYIPRINALTERFENYRAFCQGRSLAFEAEAGSGFPQILPSASGVGTDDGCLSVVFVAGDSVPKHFENPDQVPAYRYPIEHGPRAPSFSRATVVKIGASTYTFISGTAAIKGHQTVAPGDLTGQLDCTLDNLRLISAAVGLGDDLAPATPTVRHFKVYLRRASDLARTQSRLEQSLLLSDDRVSYVEADICRAALDVEIEATLITQPGG